MKGVKTWLANDSSYIYHDDIYIYLSTYLYIYSKAKIRKEVVLKYTLSSSHPNPKKQEEDKRK